MKIENSTSNADVSPGKAPAQPIPSNLDHCDHRLARSGASRHARPVLTARINQPADSPDSQGCNIRPTTASYGLVGSTVSSKPPINDLRESWMDGQDSDGAADNARKSRLHRILAAIGAFVAATAAIWAAVVTGLFGLINKPTPPEPPSNCPSFPVGVSYPAESSGANAQITFETHCAPGDGRDFLPIIEAKNIGDDNHSEFYPKKIALSPGHTDTISIDISRDPDGQVNCIYVLKPTHSQVQQILSNLTPENFTLHLPDGIPRGSQPACGRTERASNSTSSPPNSGEPTSLNHTRVEFHQPTEGSNIQYGSTVSLEGSVAGLASASLWLVTKPDAGDNHYFLTQNSPLTTTDGNWTYVDTEAGDESDVGKNITYVAVKADIACASTLASADEAVEALPPTCIVLATRSVHVN
jgi:hypothetical protein